MCRQNPQCAGNNRKRRFFDGKAPSRFSRLYEVHKDKPSRKYKLKVGSIHGLSNGAKFNIYTGSDVTSLPICTMEATDVAGFELTLMPIFQDERFPEDLDNAWALLTETSHMSEPKLFMASDDRLLPVSDALDHLRTTSPHQANFTLTDVRADAYLEVKIENDGQLGFTILDEEITRHGLHHIASKAALNFDTAVQVLRSAAHFFHHLHSSMSIPDIEKDVKIRFWQLKQAASVFSYRTATGANLMEGGIVSLEIDNSLGGEVYYGVEIVNNTSRDLYPHVFSFDSSGFAISACSSFSN